MTIDQVTKDKLVILAVIMCTQLSDLLGEPVATTTTPDPRIPPTQHTQHQQIYTGLPLNHRETAVKGSGSLRPIDTVRQLHNKKQEQPRQESSSTSHVLPTSHLVQLNGTIISRLIDDGPEGSVNSSQIGSNNSRGILQGLQPIPVPDYGIRGNNASSSRVSSVERAGEITESMDGIHHSSAGRKWGDTDKTTGENGGNKTRDESQWRGSELKNHTEIPHTTLATAILTKVLWTAKADSSSTLTTTRKPIYIRGHKLPPVSSGGDQNNQNGKTDTKTGSQSDGIKTPASMISHYGYPTHRRKPPCWPNCTNDGKAGDKESAGEPMRNTRRKHINGGGNRILNYYNQNKPSRSTASVYGWILAAAMLTVGSLVSLTGGVLLCFCGEKWKKMREERRRLEKYGEYERVESVSSLVSHVTSTDIPDEQMESVSMI